MCPIFNGDVNNNQGSEKEMQRFEQSKKGMRKKEVFETLQENHEEYQKDQARKRELTESMEDSTARE